MMLYVFINNIKYDFTSNCRATKMERLSSGLHFMKSSPKGKKLIVQLLNYYI